MMNRSIVEINKLAELTGRAFGGNRTTSESGLPSCLEKIGKVVGKLLESCF